MVSSTRDSDHSDGVPAAGSSSSRGDGTGSDATLHSQ
jgi:hypothetical protein